MRGFRIGVGGVRLAGFRMGGVGHGCCPGALCRVACAVWRVARTLHADRRCTQRGFARREALHAERRCTQRGVARLNLTNLTCVRALSDGCAGDFIEDRFGQAQKKMMTCAHIKADASDMALLFRWFGSYLVWDAQVCTCARLSVARAADFLLCMRALHACQTLTCGYAQGVCCRSLPCFNTHVRFALP